MNRWFRHYAGMMRDEKLVRAAMRSKQSIERVVWVWGAILESASEIDDGGRYEIDHAEMAWFLRADVGDIAAVEDALRDAGRVGDGVVVRWKDRQFQSDRSAERQRRYRDRHAGAGDGVKPTKPESRDVEVTSLSRHGDAPETENREQNSPSLRSGEGARAKRLSESDELSDEMRADATAAGLAPQRHDSEWAKMRDWSLAAKDGARKDWRAAWRNWCRRAAETPPARGSPPPRKQHLSDFLSANFPAQDDQQTRPPEPVVLNLPARRLG